MLNVGISGRASDLLKDSRSAQIAGPNRSRKHNEDVREHLYKGGTAGVSL